MATLPDNRIRLPAAKIDFANDVGLSGLNHDSYPQPSGQARYDHMRMFLIGLLAQQASFEEPTEFREGSPWFDLNVMALKIRLGNSWVSYAEAIPLTEPDTDGNIVTLAEWYTAVQGVLTGLSPEVVFSGICNANSVTSITIPESLQSALNSDSRVFLYINGALVNPHNCSLVGSPPTTISLAGVVLSNGDTFIVSIRRIGGDTYLPTTVVIS